MDTSSSISYIYSKAFYLDYYKNFEPYPSIFSLNLHSQAIENTYDIDVTGDESITALPGNPVFEKIIASLLLCPERLEKIPKQFKSNPQCILILYSIFHRKYIQLAGEYKNKMEANLLWQSVLTSTQWIDVSLLNNPAFIEALIQRINDCRILAYAGLIVRNNRKLINHYVVKHPVGGEMVSLVGEDLMKNQKFLSRFLNKHASAMWNLPDYLLTEQFFLTNLPHFPMLFETISQAWREDFHFIAKAAKCFRPDKLNSYFIPYIANDNLMMAMMAEFDTTGNISQTIRNIELKLKLDEQFSGYDNQMTDSPAINNIEYPHKI
jgi:hypothetical protein